MGKSPRVIASSLYELPVELRLELYKHMTPPVDARLSDWTGLFLSCKRFHYEMKHEFPRNTLRYLEQMMKDWVRINKASLRIPMPKTIASIESISVSIPNSYFRTREAQFPAARIFSATLLSLLQLGISQITFSRYKDDEKMNRTTAPITEHSLADFMRDLLDLMDPSKSARTIKLDDGTECTVSQGSIVGKIAFEWGVFDGALGDEDLVLPYYASECPADRTVEMIRGHICAPAIGAVWSRKRYTWYGQVMGDIWQETVQGAM